MKHSLALILTAVIFHGCAKDNGLPPAAPDQSAEMEISEIKANEQLVFQVQDAKAFNDLLAMPSDSAHVIQNGKVVNIYNDFSKEDAFCLAEKVRVNETLKDDSLVFDKIQKNGKRLLLEATMKEETLLSVVCTPFGKDDVIRVKTLKKIFKDAAEVNVRKKDVTEMKTTAVLRAYCGKYDASKPGTLLQQHAEDCDVSERVDGNEWRLVKRYGNRMKEAWLASNQTVWLYPLKFDDISLNWETACDRFFKNELGLTPSIATPEDFLSAEKLGFDKVLPTFKHTDQIDYFVSKDSSGLCYYYQLGGTPKNIVKVEDCSSIAGLKAKLGLMCVLKN